MRTCGSAFTEAGTAADASADGIAKTDVPINIDKAKIFFMISP
jgi:hypothetical protein